MNAFNYITQWWQQRIINQSTIKESAWNYAFARLPILHGLNNNEKKRLKDLAILFLHKKDITPAQDFHLTENMRLTIALQACLPILNLDIAWYRDWVSVIVYPSGYWSKHNYTDSSGVTHDGHRAVLGEAWQRGPVILSWSDTEHAGCIDGDNLVIHEFAHKLDLLNGDANGYPPLHKGMHHDQWVETFSQAYHHFINDLDNPERAPINPYAGHSPGEFFAVFSEVFFEQPWIINDEYPQVYSLLKEFYRQDPLLWFM